MRCGPLFLFLDYDGTLTPIVKTPDDAVLDPAVKCLLKRLSSTKGCRLAIVSGRALPDIKKRVGLRNAIYCGNHGLEICGPGLNLAPPVGSDYVRMLKKIGNNLIASLSAIKGAYVENKRFTLSVHYRVVSREQVPLLKSIFHKNVIVPAMKDRLRIHNGKKVLEIRPAVSWNKGSVVLWLLGRQRGKNVFPIYIGDDATDEDAFRVIGDTGLSVLVGKPRSSHAAYYLKDTDEVTTLLRRVLQLREKNICPGQ